MLEDSARQGGQARAESGLGALDVVLYESQAEATGLPADVFNTCIDHVRDFIQKERMPATALTLQPKNSTDGADAVRPHARDLLRKHLTKHAHRLESIGLRYAKVTGDF